MTPEEIQMISQAQDYARRRKTERKKIHCPFAYPETDAFTAEHCKVCFKWTELEYIPSEHPCMKLTDDELRKRFWRNPKLHESV